MEVVYKLWEGSWADGAVVADVDTACSPGPTGSRCVRHDGQHYSVDALHLSEPSPQRTPVLYQAGTSPAGARLCGRHAECVFMSGPSIQVIAPRVIAIRTAALTVQRASRSLCLSLAGLASNPPVPGQP